MGAAFRCLQVGLRGEWSGSTGWGGQAVRTGGAGWGGQAVRTGGAGAAESGVAQSAVGDRCGALPVPGFAKQSAVLGQQMRRGRMKDAVVLADLHLALPFPQVAFFKGANLPKPVHASRPRPTRTPSTPHTHPAYAPSSDAQPYKKPADLPPPPLFPQVTLPQNPNLPIFCTFPTK